MILRWTMLVAASLTALATGGAAQDTTTNQATQAVSGTRPQGIPEDATEFRGHHYAFVSAAVTWKEAQAACAKAGGHLVSVSDKAEGDFVNSVARERPCWIGISSEGWMKRHFDAKQRGKQENDFRWIDNTPFRFAAWWPGDPNGGNEENFGCIWYRRHGKKNRKLTWGWQDSPNDNKQIIGYICEWDK